MIHRVGVTEASSLTARTVPATIDPSIVVSARPPRCCLRRKCRAIFTSVVLIVCKAHPMKTVAIQTGASIVHDPSTLPNLLFWQAYRPQAHRTSRLRENGVAFYC